MLGLLAAHEGEARPTGKQGVERRALSILCRKCCAVPLGLDFVPLLLPGTDVRGFPVSPLRGWSNSAAHFFFAALGVATQTRSRPSGTRPGFRLRPKPQQRLP